MAPEYGPHRPLELDWLEPFEWKEPDIWAETSDLPALAGQLLADPKLEAATWLLYNRERAMQLHGWREALHTVPAAEHYPNTYLWDSGFFIEMYAEAGDLAGRAADFLGGRLEMCEDPQNRLDTVAAITALRHKSQQFIRAAVTESFWIANRQKDNGFIANLQFKKGFPRWFDIEWYFSADKLHRSSNYTQPPVLGMSTMAAYKALKRSDPEAAQLYAEEMFGSLDKFFEFFAKHRQHSDSNFMAGVVDPHETGMDSSVQWDYTKPMRPKPKGPNHDVEELFGYRIVDGAYAVLRQAELGLTAGLDTAKQRELFWALDMSFNGIYFHNLQAMAWLANELGYTDRVRHYRELADKVERSIIDSSWFNSEEGTGTGEPKVRQKGFYSLDKTAEPIDKITISNLFALLLPHISEEQLESLLDMMDEHFNVPFPLPSCSTRDPAYDPHNHEADRLWRGPTWLNTNWYLVEFGLKMQSRRDDINEALKHRCRAWTVRIGQASRKLLEINHQTDVSAERALGALIMTRRLKGKRADRYKKYITGAWEHYNPHFGYGQRRRVINFGWSWLGVFINYEEDMRQLLIPAVAAEDIKDPVDHP